MLTTDGHLPPRTRVRRITKTAKPAPAAKKRRARNDDDKRLRRRSILEAARAVFLDTSYAGLCMTDVAARAGLVKGTLYIYFRTKEGLLFALFEELYWRWLDDLDAALAAEARLTPERIADAFVGGLSRNEPLARLLTVLQTVLEHNVSADMIRCFKRAVTERLAPITTRLEAAFPALRPGHGRRAYYRALALAIGLKQIGDPAPIVAAIHEEPEFRSQRIDFATELRAALVTYFRGVERSDGAPS